MCVLFTPAHFASVGASVVRANVELLDNVAVRLKRASYDTTLRGDAAASNASQYHESYTFGNAVG